MAVGSIIAIIGCLMLIYQFRLETTMYDLMPGMFILGSGLGFIMALSTDIALINISDENQNNASGIATVSQTLGESMVTAIIGVILILGVIGGIVDAIDIYAPQYSENDHIHQDIYNYFQKMGNLYELKSQESIVIAAADIIVQNAMGFEMIVTTILMGVVFALTLRLDDTRIKIQ